MSHAITVSLSDQAYAALESQAQEVSQSPAELAEASLEEKFAPGAASSKRPIATEAEKEAGRARLRRFFGIVKSSKPLDNDELDAELAREYGSSHEDD
ncbi:MAG TPA: hypothetical protein VHR72_01385 [Gemmataceae bacterium]|nr:hypothetical protein [Gemmataceae bacterium]